MLRNLIAHSVLLNALAADTGAPAGGTAVAEAPPATPATQTAPPAAPPGDTVTGETPARAKRGRGAAGMSVFPVDTIEAGKALAKEKGKRFTVFTVKSPPAIGKPDRFFVSNHRNAVQHHVSVLDGYNFASGTGERGAGRPLTPEGRVAKAETLLAEMDDSARAALFAKYIGTNPTFAAQLPPAAAPRNDTSADFAATLANPGMPGSPRAAAQSAQAAPTATATPPHRPTAPAGGKRR